MRANGVGLRPPVLGGAVKDSNGEKQLWRGRSIRPTNGGAGRRLSQTGLGCNTPAPSPAPHKPHHALLGSADPPASSRPLAAAVKRSI